MRVVSTADVHDRTVDYVYSASSVGRSRDVIRGLAPASSTGGVAAERFHLDVAADDAALLREHVAARRSRAKRSAGGGFLLPYRRPASGLRRRSAAEPINDTGAFTSSLRQSRPASAATRTIELNRPLAQETGARISGQESYWEASRRRPRSAQTAQQRAAADAARKGGRPGVRLRPSTSGSIAGGADDAAALTDVTPGTRRRPRSAGSSRFRRRPLSASASSASLRAQQAQAQAQVETEPPPPWHEVTYKATSDPVGLLATPMSVSAYSIGRQSSTAEVAPSAAPLTWGRLLRGWHAMCDVGPALRAVGLAPPAPRTPAIELARRTTQQLDERNDIGAGRRFALAVAEHQLVLARAVLNSAVTGDLPGVNSNLVARVAQQLPLAMLAVVQRECAPAGAVPSSPADVLPAARAVSLLTGADRAQMVREGERTGPAGEPIAPSPRVYASSSCLVVLMAIAKYGAGPAADDALASSTDWGHVRKILSPEGAGAIGDGWQVASQLILRLATSKSTKLMKPETAAAAAAAAHAAGSSRGRRARPRAWLQRSVVACLAPMLTSPEFLANKGGKHSVFGGWPAMSRWLATWFAFVVHPDDLDVVWEWRQHHKNKALSGALAAAVSRKEQEAPAPTPTPGWAATYLAPASSTPEDNAGSPVAAAAEWRLDSSATLALMAFLEPPEIFSLAQSSASLWRWLHNPAVLAPVWTVAARAHASAARALARRHRRLPRAERQTQQERACIRLEEICAAASGNSIAVRDLLAHCSPGGSSGLSSTPSAYTLQRRLSARLEFACEAYYMMWQQEPAAAAGADGGRAAAAAEHAASSSAAAASAPSLWYKPASRYGSQLCSNWAAASAHLLSHITASGPLSALRGSSSRNDHCLNLSVEGVLSLLEKLPPGARATLPERMLPWTSVLMQPAWSQQPQQQEQGNLSSVPERLAVAIGQVVLAADCAARVATGAVTEYEDVAEQLGIHRMRRFTELAQGERL